jgi:hypothetical protein
MAGKRNYRGYHPGWDSAFEQQISDHLRGLEIPFEYERESLVFVKTISKSVCRECGSKRCGQERVYTPDFFLPDGVILEAKGYFDPSARARHKLIREQHPRLDLRLVFQRNHIIQSSKNKIRYSNWCEDNDIKYWVCDVQLPSLEWLRSSQWS